MENVNKSGRAVIAKRVLLVLLAAALLGLLVVGGNAYQEAKNLKSQASGLKAELKTAIGCIAGMDTEGAEAAIQRMDNKIEGIQESLEDPLWRFARKIPSIGQNVESAGLLVGFLNEVSEEILKPTVTLMKENPLSGLRTANGFNTEMIHRYLDFVEEISPKLEVLAEKMNSVELGIIDSDGKLSQYIQAFNVVSGLLKTAVDEIIDPLTLQLEQYPLDQLKSGNGFNVNLMIEYMDFAQEMVPAAQRFYDQVGETDLTVLDSEGKIAHYMEKLGSLLALYEENKGYLPLVRTLLGDGSDRYYVIVAQNSAEIRASGGFPGSFGYMTIQNGVMEVGEFSKTHDNLDLWPPAEVAMNGQDEVYFGWWVTQSWDAGLCPDFERVAEIWAATYEAKRGVTVDGMISVTPSVIQDILKVYGGVTLSDGTEVNGDNATKMLQYDLYYTYHGQENFVNDEVLDALFEETAKLAIAKVVSGFNVRQLVELLEIFKEDTADRTIMLWLADEEEEALCREMGCSGGLSDDPENPVAGVYYSCWTSSKLGWFVDLNTECSEATVNEDGSQSYQVTVTVNNVITEEEYEAGSWYIVGDAGSSIYSNVDLFAPMGGTITDLTISRSLSYGETIYKDLQFIYINGFYLNANEPVTFNYTVTTSPEAKTPLTFSTTPTLQEYRE